MKPNPFPALNHLTVPVSFITSPWQQLEAGVSIRMGSDRGNSQALSAHMKTCVMLKSSLILAFWWPDGVRRALRGPEGSRFCRQMVVAKGVYMRQGAERDVFPTQARVIMVRYTRYD